MPKATQARRADELLVGRKPQFSIPMKLSPLFITTPATQKLKRVARNTVPISSIKQLHGRLIRTHSHTDPDSMTPIIKAYASSSSPSLIREARLAFNELKRPTLLILNFMLRGLSQGDHPTEAIEMYNNLMYYKGVSGDKLTFIFLFKACARVKDVLRGQTFHVRALKLGFESYLVVSNVLIHMYASFSHVGYAQKVFDQMGETVDLISWNSLICGYSQCNMFSDVLGLFNSMEKANVKADSVTMVKVIMAASFLGDWSSVDNMVNYIKENNVHVDVYLGNTLIDMYGRRGLMDLAQKVFDELQERNTVSWNAMITGYAKMGNLVAATELFHEMPRKNVISWTSLITGYAQANLFSDAVKLFKGMMQANVKPDEITVATVLSACAHLGWLHVGQAVHDYINLHGIRADVCVGNALTDMYCKCGAGEKAVEVFHEMKEKDNVSWISIISGLAVNGFAQMALEFFSKMLRDGVHPTHGCFIGVLLACTHTGMVDEGLEYFQSMEKVYGLTPEMKHYGCVVDLLSRFGNLDRAYEFIMAMPVIPDVVIWRIFLSACKLHRNLPLAVVAANRLLDSDPSNSGNYVLLSNTYADSDRWDDATKVRELMQEGDRQKPSGWSSIEAWGNNV